MSAPVSMPAAPATTAPAGPSRAGRSDGDGAGFEHALRAQAGTPDDSPTTTADTGSGAEQSGGDAQPTTPDAPAVPVVDPSVAAQLVTPLVALPVAAGTTPTGPVTGQESTNVSVLAASVTLGSPAGAVKGQEPTDVSVLAAPVAPVTAVEGQELTNVSVRVAAGPEASGSPVPQAVPSVLDAPAGAEPFDAPAVPVPAADTTPAPTSVLPTAPAAPAAPVAAPAPTSAGAPTAPPVPVHSQVVTAVTPLLRGPDGTHELTLRLDPDGLGAVHVRLSVSGDEVRMHLVAADAGTREALRDGLAELRTSLEEVGLRATQLDVGTGSDPRGQTGPGTDPQHRARGAALPAGRHGPAPPDPAVHPPAPRTDHRPDTRLDLRM